MRKIQQASFGLTSIFVAAVLVGFDSQIALACSGAGSTSSGLSHGSKIGSGSVTVCVGSSGSSAGSAPTRTITKTVKVPVPAKTKPAPKPASKPAAKPAKAPIRKTAVTPVSCPSASQRASMPRSADAAQRWVQSICSPPPKKAVTATKSKPKPPSKTKTITITETIVVSTPSRKTFSTDAVEFSPNDLVASVFPVKMLEIGELAKFSSNPSSHFSSAIVLGRQAQVHFVPKASRWRFSDGVSLTGVDTQRTFISAGRFQIRAYVEYLVSYRILGESAWKPVAGTILVESNLLELEVGSFIPSQDPSTQGVLLVGEDCIDRAGVFGCDT